MRSLRPLGLLVLVLAGLGAYIYFGQSDTPQDGEARPTVFEGVKADAIAEVVVRTDSDRTTLRKVEGRWQVVEPVAVKADEGEASALASSLATVENVRVVEENPSDLSLFGLAAPRVEVGFRVEGSKEFRHLRIGNKTPTQGELYASRGGKQVFLVPAYLESSFAKTTFDLRDKTALAFDRDKVDRVEIQAPGRSVVVAKSDDQWRLVAPVEVPADFGTVEGLIGRLQTAQMKAIAAPESADLARYGLDRPAVTATVSAGSARATLLVGRKAEGETFYAKDASRPMVFTVESSLVDELQKPDDDLRNKDAFAFRPFNAKAIEITRGTQTWSFERKKGDGGDTVESWHQVRPTAKKVDQSKFDELLGGLSNLRAQSFVPPGGATKTGLESPVLVVTVRFGDGQQQEKVSFGRAGADVFGATALPGAMKIDATEFEQVIKLLESL